MAWQGRRGQEGEGTERGRNTTAVHVSSVVQHGQCVCLMLLIDFQSQLTGPSHSTGPTTCFTVAPPPLPSPTIAGLNLLSLLLHTRRLAGQQ